MVNIKLGKYGQINDLRGWACNYKTSPNYNPYKLCIYKTWLHMLERCYDSRVWQKHPTYQGCVVDPRWFRFSNFVKDVRYIPGFNQYIRVCGEGYALDKDTLVIGNRLYSLQTCSFITIGDNSRELISRLRTPAERGHTVGRPVQGINVSNPNDVLYFNSIEETKQSGFLPSSVSKVCKGITKTHKGYYWRYV